MVGNADAHKHEGCDAPSETERETFELSFRLPADVISDAYVTDVDAFKASLKTYPVVHITQ